MKKTILAVAVLLASYSAVAANNPEDWRVSYESVMNHYNGGRYSQVLAELPRLGLTGDQVDVVWKAIQSGQTWTNMQDFDKWLTTPSTGGNGGNPGNPDCNCDHVKTSDYKKDQAAQKDVDAGQNAAIDAARKDGKEYTDQQVSAADQRRKEGDDALSGRIDDNKAAQAERDAGQDKHIDAVQGAAQTANERASALEGRADASEGAIRGVQGAAQTANDRATALEGRADATEGAIRDTNGQLVVTDERSRNNATRLDAAENGIRDTNGQLAVTDKRSRDNATRLDGAEGAIRKTNDQLVITDKRSQDNAQRITGAEKVNTRQDAEIATKASKSELAGSVAAQKKVDNAQNEWIGSVESTSNAAWQRSGDALQAAGANSAAIGQEARSRASGDAQTLRNANAYTDSRFSSLRSQIEDNRNEARAGVAGAMAMSQIPQVGHYGNFSVGAGAGTYVNQQAVAVGFSARVAERVITKGAVSADSASNFGAGIGIGVEW